MILVNTNVPSGLKPPCTICRVALGSEKYPYINTCLACDAFPETLCAIHLSERILFTKDTFLCKDVSHPPLTNEGVYEFWVKRPDLCKEYHVEPSTFALVKTGTEFTLFSADEIMCMSQKLYTPKMVYLPGANKVPGLPTSVDSAMVLPVMDWLCGKAKRLAPECASDLEFKRSLVMAMYAKEPTHMLDIDWNAQTAWIQAQAHLFEVPRPVSMVILMYLAAGQLDKAEALRPKPPAPKRLREITVYDMINPSKWSQWAHYFGTFPLEIPGERISPVFYAPIEQHLREAHYPIPESAPVLQFEEAMEFYASCLNNADLAKAVQNVSRVRAMALGPATVPLIKAGTELKGDATTRAWFSNSSDILVSESEAEELLRLMN